MQFLEHGLRYAFPVEHGALSHGIRCRATEKRNTATKRFSSRLAYVEGTVRGTRLLRFTSARLSLLWLIRSFMSC